MNTIFRISLFISFLILIFLGWTLVFLGLGIIPIAKISPFIDKKIAISGFVIWGLVLFLLSLEKNLFHSDDVVNIEGEYGSIKITKDAIRDVIKGIEIDGIDEITCKVTIKGKMVNLKILATSFSHSMEGIADSINKEIDSTMNGLMIKDYKKIVYINHIKKGRKLI